MADEKKYSLRIIRTAAVPRRQLRSGSGSVSQGAGASSTGGSPAVTGAQGGTVVVEGHTHQNKADLDKLSVADGYVRVAQDVLRLDPATGETYYEHVPVPAKAGYADEAKTLSPDSPILGEFLSKTKEDMAQKRITFKEGLDAGTFAEGMSGARINPDGSSEFGEVTIRGALQAAEIRFNRVTYSAGDKVLSAGGGKILSVTPDVDADGNLLDTGTIKLKLEEGEYGAVAVDDICFGIFHDLSNASNNADADYDDGRGNLRYAGFYTVYFRITEITEKTRNSEFRYSLRPASERWSDRHHPSALMDFAAYGNFTDKDRQDSYFAGRGYQRYLKGVNDWEVTLANIVQQAGRLSNLTVFGKALEGYGEYLNNIYMTGALQSADGSVVLDAMNRTMKLGDGLTYSPSNGLRIKGSVIVDGSGEQVTLPNYKGLWEATTSYSKGDTVTYQGTTYIYAYALPTSGHAPTEAGYWSVYAKGGEDAYTVVILPTTANGNFIRNGQGSVTLSASAYKGGADITGSLSDSQFSWRRISDSAESDETWNAAHKGVGRIITVTKEEVYRTVSIECEISA